MVGRATGLRVRINEKGRILIVNPVVIRNFSIGINLGLRFLMNECYFYRCNKILLFNQSIFYSSDFSISHFALTLVTLHSLYPLIPSICAALCCCAFEIFLTFSVRSCLCNITLDNSGPGIVKYHIMMIVVSETN